MDRFKPREGTPAPYAAHMNYIADSMDQAFRGALADYIALSQDFFIDGAVITTTPSGTAQQHVVTDGFICYHGEVMPVHAHNVVQTSSQVVFFVVRDDPADTAPVSNIDGVLDYVMRHRHAVLQVASVYPTDYMVINAPRKEVLDRLRFRGRVMPVGGIIPYYGPMTNFTNNGLGVVGTDMDGFAICNGLNNTPDLRGMALFGASGVPSSGAPPMYPGATVSSSIGERVGKDGITLDVDQLPAHKHPLVFNSPQYPAAGPGVTGSSAFVGGASHEYTDWPTETEDNATGNLPVDVRQASFGIVWIMSIV